ncbi:DUF5134 domain-containing protein [Nocardia cyriacigeorgica]|uniref:DUF5134 domain-containing protein n=1 Tax=Nocardia cyriacigeorgica TaxID=135487 RepID=A0A6P1D2M4_9NOCA|nr:DUF5134 domain-containing protein [Nocardia cyriacigeorgica]NEW39401.1 DUF5134 domain-containing protein [Nocardia cyriacigeorgica]NEW43691.1 DUF5134 domain-containing protein [Nocardia cyriacigeorgica]NEW49907.1 DUF5134 domain-containing protein [Nocardia cyriacigeorgica]NEW54642.1 DUF5134 domain-containing protein [Nocardia cyriacigeorgica]
MAEFVLEYATVRWMAVAAFVVAGAVVAARVMATVPVHVAPAGSAGAVDQGCAVGRVVHVEVDSRAAPLGLRVGADDRESDAAHLIMCAVMLAMLVFPAHAHAHAMRGVLIAMAVAFGTLLMVRAAEWHAGGRVLPVARMSALGYHLLAATVMLYAMSGHTMSGHSGGPGTAPAIGLAVLFLADAAMMFVCAITGRHHRWLVHAGSRPAALVPHVVMDLGMVYMLVAAAAG